MAQSDPGGNGERAGSPPTDRVVAVVELLAGQTDPSSVASIAARLDLNRSTATAILQALERAGWAVRQDNRSYTLGPALISVADAVRETWPVSGRFTDAIEELAQRAGCGASLASVGSTELTFLCVVRGEGRIPPGVSVGVRLPLVAGVGAAVIAHRDAHVRQTWLASAPTGNRDLLDDVLAQIQQHGVAVFGLGDTDPKMLDVLAEVAELLIEHPRRAALRQRVFELLGGLGGNPYTAKQLESSEALSVSYLTAAVFDNGRAVYELQLGPLRSAVSVVERNRYIREIRATAAKLSTP